MDVVLFVRSVVGDRCPGFGIVAEDASANWTWLQ